MRSRRVVCVQSIFAAIVLGVVSMQAQAAYLTAWSPTPTYTDPVDGAFTAGQDILAVWFAEDTSYYYFRMDLRGAPTYLGTDYAGLYGIYIDYEPGGGDRSNTTYIPSGVLGVDYIVDAHFNNFATQTFDQFDTHSGWNPSTSAFAPPGDPVAQQQSENGGTTIEWQINKADVPATQFTFYAATHDDGSSAETYDVTSGFFVPEPATIVMFGFGALVLCNRR